MKAIYERTISDVAKEISIAREWRREIFKLKENDALEISYEKPYTYQIIYERKW